jgi:hypothetical protein
MIITLRLLTSSRRDRKATLFIKSSRDTDRSRYNGNSNVDADPMPRNRRGKQSSERSHRQYDESDVNDKLSSADERMERPLSSDLGLPPRKVPPPPDEAPGDEEPRDDAPRDEKPNDEGIERDIRPVADLPRTEIKDEPREREMESAEYSQGRGGDKSHNEEDPIDKVGDIPLGERQHPIYVDPASSQRKSSAAVKIDAGMDSRAEAAVDLTDVNQQDIVDEDPRLTSQQVDVQSPLLTSGHTATGDFHKDIGRVADFKKNVVLTVVDTGYVPMAVNFFRTSVASVGLENFLMVCTDIAAVQMLRSQGIACSLYVVPMVSHVHGSSMCAMCVHLCLFFYVRNRFCCRTTT